MAGYFGTKHQIELLKSAERAVEWMGKTPGACNPCRFLGTDDPDRLGWDTIFDTLERDQIFGFRLIRSENVDEVSIKLSERGYRFDAWDVFMANAGEAESKTFPVIASGLPDRFYDLSRLEGAEHADTRKVQSFLAANGIAPFSGSMLVGDLGPVTTVVVVDQHEEIAAVAHGYLPHNEFSPHSKSAWAGLIAVSPACRGQGLGKYVNAKIVANCFSALGADTVYELVSSDNVPSRKMVEASGLQLDPAFKSGAATAGNERFTR
jgi:RimJ/RimL family protein N-acetyltransferase